MDKLRPRAPWDHVRIIQCILYFHGPFFSLFVMGSKKTRKVRGPPPGWSRKKKKGRNGREELFPRLDVSFFSQCEGNNERLFLRQTSSYSFISFILGKQNETVIAWVFCTFRLNLIYSLDHWAWDQVQKVQMVACTIRPSSHAYARPYNHCSLCT